MASPAFDERLDGIVYATRAGLGYRRLAAHAREALRLDELTHAPRPTPRLPFGMGFVLR